MQLTNKKTKQWAKYAEKAIQGWEQCSLFVGYILFTQLLSPFQEPPRLFIAQSTVLLAVNVGFLAIPVVSDSGSGKSNRFTCPIALYSSLNKDNNTLSPAAVASQISVLASLGSIIISVMFLHQHKINEMANRFVRMSSLIVAN